MAIDAAKIRELMNWYADGLSGIFPQSWRAEFAAPHRLFSVKIGSNGYTVVETRHRLIRRKRALEGKHFATWPEALDFLLQKRRFLRRMMAVELIVDAAECFFLEREVPAKARAQAGNILRLELERVTPFSIREVFSDHYFSSQKPKAGKNVPVNLVVAKRTIFAAIIDDLTNAKIALSGIGVVHANGGRYPVNLLEQGGSARPVRSFGASLNRAGIAAALLAVISLSGFLFYDYWKRSEAINNLELQLAQVRKEAIAFNQNVRTIEEQLAKVGTLRAGRASQPMFLDIWEETSRWVPQDAWLTNINKSGDSVTLIGFAKSASTLIRALSKSNLFRDVEFASPVSRDGHGNERFEIKLNLNPKAKQDANLSGGEDGKG